MSSELASLIEANTRIDGSFPTPIPGFHLSRYSSATQPGPYCRGVVAIRFVARSHIAGGNGMLPLSATLCCHWRHSRCTLILPPSAIQFCHLIRSGLDCQIQRSEAAWRLQSEKQVVRCGLPVTRELHDSLATSCLHRRTRGTSLCEGDGRTRLPFAQKVDRMPRSVNLKYRTL
jgi:hypothetical protein